MPYVLKLAVACEPSVSRMKETTRRRITVTSSLIEIFTEPLGNRIGVGVTPPAPIPFYKQASGHRYLKNEVNGFSSSSDICFMVPKFT